MPAGGVVVAYRFDADLPSRTQPVPPLAPGETWVKVDGRPAILSRTPTSLSWHFSGAPEFIEARWDPANSDAALDGIRLVVESWHWQSP